nr:hypothetical protein [uncultured Blautia sp.]
MERKSVIINSEEHSDRVRQTTVIGSVSNISHAAIIDSGMVLEANTEVQNREA